MATQTDSPTHSAAPGRSDVVVLGAGLAGLVAAATAARAGATVRLVEPHAAGGRARVDQRDGFALNRGPRAIYVGGIAERTLLDLGITSVRAGSAPRPHHAGARWRGATDELPAGPLSGARARFLTAGDKARLARALPRLLQDRPEAHATTTLAERLDEVGLGGAPRQLVEALVRVGSYANAPEVVPAGAVLANARRGLRPGVRYLDGGWQPLVDGLEAELARLGVARLAGRATSVAPDRAGGVAVALADGTTLTAAAAVVAVGGPDAAAGLLGGRPASWPELGPPATAACLELGLRRAPHRRFVLGIDEPTYLSTHAPPARLAPDGQAVVHLMRYRPIDDDLAADAVEAQLHDVARQAGVDDADIVTERFLSRMVVCGALPIARAGGLAGRVPVTGADHPAILLAGDWVGPEGLLADAVCASAVDAGRRAAARSATMVRR